jgi:hypothetical protein
VGAQIDAFKSRLPEDIKPAKASRKRKQETVPDDSGIDWEKKYREGELHGCKVPDLKKFLRSVGLPVSGNKGVVRFYFLLPRHKKTGILLLSLTNFFLSLWNAFRLSLRRSREDRMVLSISMVSGGPKRFPFLHVRGNVITEYVL